MKLIGTNRYMGVQVGVAFFLAWTLIPTRFFFPFLLAFGIYGSYAFQPKPQDKKPPNSEPPKSCPLQDGLSQIKKELDDVEQLLEDYGSLIEASGTICQTTFTRIYKEHKEQLRKYSDLSKHYAEVFGSIVNVLEAHGEDIADNFRFTTEQSTSLCEVIKQYRQMVEDNRKLVNKHIDSVAGTLERQDKAITQNRELFDERDGAIHGRLDNHSQLIEQNNKLIQEHGTSIDKVVSDHADLAAEYQKALDGLVALITANRISALMDETPGWKSLGSRSWRVHGGKESPSDIRQLAQEPEQPVKAPETGISSVNVIDNVQDIARTLRGTRNEMIKPIHGNPKGTGGRRRRARRQDNNPTKPVEHPDREPDTSSGKDQMVVTASGVLNETLQTTAEAGQAEEMNRILQGQEDMKKLRAEIGDIQQLRGMVREAQELREKLTLAEEKQARLEKEVEKMQRDQARCEKAREAERDEALREEVRKVLREEMSRKPVKEDTTTTTATTNLTASTDGDTATSSTITDPTDASYPIPNPTGNGDDDARNPSDHGADVAADDEEGDNRAGDSNEGRMLGDSLGRMLAREDWADKKKPRRKTRKMYAIQAQKRAEQQMA